MNTIQGPLAPSQKMLFFNDLNASDEFQVIFSTSKTSMSRVHLRKQNTQCIETGPKGRRMSPLRRYKTNGN